MKIFLNDRTIAFEKAVPADVTDADLVLTDPSGAILREGWETFSGADNYRRMIITTPGGRFSDNPASWSSFKALFRIIPAAGGIVKSEKGDLLFIHRLGYWDLPKGKIDKKDIPGKGYSISDMESAYAAALREVREETGLRIIKVNGLRTTTWHIYTQNSKWILKPTHWFDMQADSDHVLKPETKEGIFLARWVPLEEVPALLPLTYASLRELLLDSIS